MKKGIHVKKERATAENQRNFEHQCSQEQGSGNLLHEARQKQEKNLNDQRQGHEEGNSRYQGKQKGTLFTEGVASEGYEHLRDEEKGSCDAVGNSRENIKSYDSGNLICRQKCHSQLVITASFLNVNYLKGIWEFGV